ncbi:MAG TPA: choice-of-anchor D domain-containing protein [Terriglobales bacterium]|nr:choice-of-anchor D domain-containing protein [Terriglobales bacterium]
MSLPHLKSDSVFFAMVAVLILGTGYQSAQASALALNPSTLPFGQVTLGSTRTMYAKLTNQSSSNLILQRVHSSQANFTVSYPSLPLTMAPGHSVWISVKFAPSSTSYTTGTVFFNWGQAGTLGLNGRGGATQSSMKVSPSPSSLSFGSVQIGSTATLPLSLKNTGTVQAKISSISTNASAFAVQNLSLPLTLPAGQSYTFKVAFDPTATGTVNGTLKALSSSGASLASVGLTGSGGSQGQLSLSPASVSFGNVNVGSSVSKSGTLTASGSNVTVNSAGSNSAEFVLSGITLPTTIASGKSVSYSVIFKPQSSGSASATISFASTASDATLSESLSGTGVSTTPPTQHSVDLNWSPSTSKVAGYNVYRGGKSGGPYTKLNGAPDTATAYTDSSVSSSTTYYYVTTAVNSSGQESAYSNQVQVPIP